MQPAKDDEDADWAEWGALTWNKDNMVNAATAFPVSCFTSCVF